MVIEGATMEGQTAHLQAGLCRFHTRTARHYFCKVCDMYPFLHKRVTPDNLGINVHCLEGFSPEGIPVRQAVGAAMP